MFWRKSKPKCKHTSGFGESRPKNMVVIVRFNEYDYADELGGHSVCQCNKCGKRMFATVGYHLIVEPVTTAIDGLINYNVELQVLLDALRKHKFKSIIYHDRF